MYLDFSQYQIYQNTPTLALGSLFHAYPFLIVRDEATDWMRGVFASADHESQARLLGAIHDFLKSEAEKKAAGKSDQDIKALIGNKDELGQSGYVHLVFVELASLLTRLSASAIVVQRNMDSILHGARSLYPLLQHAALDVLTFIVKQGLSHPLEVRYLLLSFLQPRISAHSNAATADLDLARNQRRRLDCRSGSGTPRAFAHQAPLSRHHTLHRVCEIVLRLPEGHHRGAKRPATRRSPASILVFSH